MVDGSVTSVTVSTLNNFKGNEREVTYVPQGQQHAIEDRGCLQIKF